MGEARKRGSFKQRRDSAILRDESARIKRLELQAEIERNKTPEQKQREREAITAYSQMLALADPYLPIYKALR